MLGIMVALHQHGDIGSQVLQSRAKRYESLGLLSIAVVPFPLPRVLLELPR